jgi:hypothetical protein
VAGGGAGAAIGGHRADRRAHGRFANLEASLGGKWLELLSRLLIMFNPEPDTSQGGHQYVGLVRDLLEPLGDSTQCVGQKPTFLRWHPLNFFLGSFVRRIERRMQHIRAAAAAYLTILAQKKITVASLQLEDEKSSCPNFYS